MKIPSLLFTLVIGETYFINRKTYVRYGGEDLNRVSGYNK